MDEAQELTRDELRSKRISTEEMVRNQIDRINFLRGNVENPDRVSAWSESVEALCDLLIPWHDDQFRSEWDNRSVAVIMLGRKKVPIPTATDCREAQQICMRLLQRSGLLVKTRKISGPAPKVKVEEDSPAVPM